MSRTLYDKLWDRHVIRNNDDGTALIYIDRHLLHEVTSPQAFAGLNDSDRSPWRVSANYAVPDHNVPTILQDRFNIKDPESKLQVTTLTENCRKSNIYLFELHDQRQGIVHVVGPEQGLTLPGMTIVCGDSHTSTHGAFATISIGIGTSDVEHVLATQCLRQKKFSNMLIEVNGKTGDGISAKDIILYIISKIGTDGATGFAVEYAGSAITDLTMEGRMTICNMSIEAGARCGMIAVDAKTLNYVANRAFAPKGKMWDQAVAYWQTLTSDAAANFDKVFAFAAKDIAPQVSWGTSPEMTSSILEQIPDPYKEKNPVKQENMLRALKYMGLQPNTPITAIRPDHVFIGSCTNGRIEDLRVVAKIVAGKKVAKNIKQAIIVPGSGLVKEAAEREGLDKIFLDSGFEWRSAGCSMCLGMNPDKLNPGDRCASTSNRNFEGRQGRGARTHLVSPAMAAACAVVGSFVDVRTML